MLHENCKIDMWSIALIEQCCFYLIEREDSKFPRRLSPNIFLNIAFDPQTYPQFNPKIYVALGQDDF